MVIVLEAMIEQGTTDIILFEYKGHPAIADAEHPDDIITFQTYNEDEPKDTDNVH